MEIIRSGYSIAGQRLFCEHKNEQFRVISRWQTFHRTPDIHEALAIFEGLCLED